MNVSIGDFKSTLEIREIIDNILRSNKITEKSYVRKFEREVEKFLDVKHAIAVTNGTVSLQLIGHYLKYKLKKDNLTVCVPATTFPATLNAFLLTGFETMLCDIDESNLCIDIDKLSEEEKQKIDIIVPVALLGFTPDMDKIMLEAKKYNWIVIEDFAEAFGSVYKDKKIGTIGDFGSSSFFISHVIQAGELGVITTNNDEDAEIMRKMKNHGRDGNPMLFKHSYIGSNYKTTEFCAGLAYSQMLTANSIIKKRQKIVKTYYDNIYNNKIKPMLMNENHSPLGYPIIAKSEEIKNKICEDLNTSGIETRGIFPCLANQRAYEGMYDKEKYPISMDIEKRCFYIGCHQYISEIDVKKVIEIINRL